jgi:thioredoxin 1
MMTENHKVAEYPQGISEEEFNKITGKGGKVLVDVFTSWCGPCKRVKPIFQELASEKEDITFVSLDLDYTRWIGEKYDIHAIPTFLFFKDGQMIYKHLGGMFKSGFENMIEEKF